MKKKKANFSEANRQNTLLSSKTFSLSSLSLYMFNRERAREERECLLEEVYRRLAKDDPNS